jgi:hypothetical protein
MEVFNRINSPNTGKLPILTSVSVIHCEASGFRPHPFNTSTAL